MRSSPQSVSSLLGRPENSSMTSREMRRSTFNPCSYASGLLPHQNKPVDGDVFQKIKSILLETDSFRLARHVAYNDCEMCRIAESGMMDLFLARGKRFRSDLLERYQTFSFWVVACVLRGGASKQDRVDVLNVFIKIANELVHSLGDIYGFSTVMHGLMCPQLRELDELWSSLQRQHTNNAVTMEKKLLPLFRLLEEGKGQINISSTSVPHILPVIRYFENPLNEIPHHSTSTKFSEKKQLSASEGNMLGSVASDESGNSRWWENLPNDSFDSLMAQLSLARTVLSWQAELRANAIGKFQDFEKKPIIDEIFSTNFHLRLLWGYRGAGSPQKERYEKLDKLITLMAKRSTF